MYKCSKKEDLIELLGEIEDIPTDGLTIVQLKNKIEGSQSFKDDPEYVSDLLSSIVEDRKIREEKETRARETHLALEAQKIELEKLKLAQLDKQIELERIKCQNANTDCSHGNEGIDANSNLENLIRSIKTLTIPVPGKSENFNLFFQTLERAFVTKNVPERFKSEILINILGERAANILLYVNDEELKCYESIKTLVLKEFEPSAYECLLNFRKGRREPNETFIQFASRLSATFQHYCQLREVNDFDSLCKLIISDKIFQSLDKETASYINIKIGENWLEPKDLAREIDIYFVNKGKPLGETISNCNENVIKTSRFIREQKYVPPPMRSNTIKNKYPPKECYICGKITHLAKSCPQRFGTKPEMRFVPPKKEETSETNYSNKFVAKIETPLLKSGNVPQSLQNCNIVIAGKEINAIIDSGTEISIINPKYISNISYKKTGEIDLISAFGEKITAQTAKIPISIKNTKNHFSNSLIVNFAVTERLFLPCIITPRIFNDLLHLDEERISEIGINADSAAQGQRKQTSSHDLFHCCNENIVSGISADGNLPCTQNRVEHLMESFLVNLSLYDECVYDLSHILNPEVRDKISELISNYKPIKTENTNLKMNIILSDDIPVTQRYRRLSIPEKKEVNNQVSEWLKQGIITESFSNYSSPVVICRKKDGKMRLCIDYRQLNKKMIKDKYPLPNLEEVIDKLERGRIFSTLDLKNAFFHVDIDENSRKYTSFVTESGQYEFLKVPFGLANSPAVFQRYINYVFRDLLNDGTLIMYLDDIIIPSQDETEGLEKLTRVLNIASKYGLELNLKKCQFMKRKIDFLGHIIENGTIRPSKEKTIAVQNFPEPKDTKGVQSFLGLTGFFRKFIPHYAMIARPLSDLLRGSNSFKFENEQKQAFQKLKDLLSNEPILHLFKQGRSLELHTDACKLGFGAILLQKGDDENYHPIQYMSRKTSFQEEKLCSYELEVLAIIEALRKFRNYLLGSKFKIFTDCAAFAETLGKKHTTPKIARWSLYLQQFDYEIKHRPGKQMRHVDSLSRYPIMNVTIDSITHRIIKAQENEEYIETIKKLLEEGKITDYILKNNVLYKILNDREVLVVPQLMQTEVVTNAHLLGHFGATKTEDIVKREFYFPNIKKCVENVIGNCVKCILVNKKKGKGEGMLNPIPKEDIPLSTYHVNFIGPLPITNKQYRRGYDRKRKKAHVYKEGDLVAIQRTQFGSGMKLRAKFLGPYEITRVKPKDRYEVRKLGDHEGPNSTNTSADLMKPWLN